MESSLVESDIFINQRWLIDNYPGDQMHLRGFLNAFEKKFPSGTFLKILIRWLKMRNFLWLGLLLQALSAKYPQNLELGASVSAFRSAETKKERRKLINQVILEAEAELLVTGGK